MIGPEQAAAARQFIGREARLLDRRRFAHRFEGAKADGVVAALVAYRNDDGGFGHGLEPDTRGPHSQPLDTQAALDVLREVGEAPTPLVHGACEFLASVAVDGALPILLPSIADHPRASHWQATDHYDPDLNPTAGIAGTLHALGGVDHPWLEAATDWTFRRVETGGPPGEAHAIRCLLTFLEHVPDRPRAEALLPAVAEALPVSEWYLADPDDPGYGVPPYDFAPTPASPFRRWFDDELFAAHLDRLERDQQDDGGWPITWDPPSDAARLEWRAIRTYEALVVLSAHGRIG
jgi:hypothetical protein